MRKIVKLAGYIFYNILGSWLPHYQLSYSWPISKGIRKFCGKLLFDKCGKNVDIGRRCKLSLAIELGDNSSIGDGSYLQGNIKIGNDVMMGPQVMIIASNHNFSDLDLPMNKQGTNERGIIIEDNVWIGARAIILDGVRIASGTVVGAGAIVTKNTEINSIVAGSPAKKIKNR